MFSGVLGGSWTPSCRSLCGRGNFTVWSSVYRTNGASVGSVATSTRIGSSTQHKYMFKAKKELAEMSLIVDFCMHSYGAVFLHVLLEFGSGKKWIL